MYVKETILLISAAVACFVAILFIPRKRAAEASVIFLVAQFFTWIFGLVVVEFGWLEYPVRELAQANATSFLFEFLLLPVLIIYFILYYPTGKRLIIRLLYYAGIISAFTLLEVIVEKCSRIILCHTWKWQYTWITMAALYYMVMVIYKWFFGIKKIFKL